MSGAPDFARRPRLVRLAVPLAAGLLAAAQATVRATPAGAPAARSAHDAPRDSVPRSTMDGVYTNAQALQGRDVFASACQNCHTPTYHAGPPFRNKWFGRTLDELFGYMRREMPKSDPGSLSDEEYALAIAYILRINGMPSGSEPLAADSAALQRIRIDSLRSLPTPPGSRR